MALFDYTLEATSGHARAGSFETAHGIVRTPLFMPVGTSATVKGIRPRRSMRSARRSSLRTRTIFRSDLVRILSKRRAGFIRS